MPPSSDETLSQTPTVIRSPQPKPKKPRMSTTDDAFFKHPKTVPDTRERRSRSRTSKNRKTYRESSESSGDAERSPSPSASPNRSRRARKSLPVHEIPDKDSLFNMMRKVADLNTIVSDWIKKYNQNREEAVVALLEFFVNSSGNESKITLEMLRSMEMREVVDKIIADSDDNSKDCPLIVTNVRRGEFHSNFVNFINILIHKCENSIIHDDYLLETLEDFLIDLSGSELRVLRHTATLAALKVLTALIEVVLPIDSKFREIQRQLKSIDPEHKSRERKLRLQRDKLKGSSTEIHNRISNLLKSIFCDRYRDILPDIRLMCLEEYGIWIVKLPKVFRVDKYLDVIGFSLSDKITDIRFKSLKILQSLYTSVQLRSSLENFMDKFNSRIHAMLLDKDIKIAVECVKLFTIIHKNHSQILNADDYIDIYMLIFAEDRSLAIVSGQFWKEVLMSKDEQLVTRTERSKKSSNTRIIRDIVLFFIESSLPDHSDYLVDALIDNEMMQDWRCMTDLLLEKPEPGEEALAENQEMALIKIMTSCIKQAATGQSPIGRKKKALSDRDQKRIATSKRNLTTHFMETLPRLIQKYRNHYDLLGMLVTIPQNFALNLFMQNHESLQFLLDVITEIVNDASDEKVIENSSSTLQYFCDELFPGRAQCDAARNKIIASLNQNYRDAVDDYTTLITSGETTDHEALDKIIISLKKIAIFYANHDLNGFNLWDLLCEVLEKSRDPSTNFPDEAIGYSLQACYFALIWGKQRLSDVGERDEATAVNLKERLDTFMYTLQGFFDAEDSHDVPMVREKAYAIITDLLIIFNKSLRLEVNQLLHQIVHEPAPDLRDMLSAFVQNHVFIEENTQNTEYLSKNRRFLMAFCRLIMYNVLPIKSADGIFKNYVRYYNEYGDIIKMTLTRAREINRDTWALTIQLSLSKLFDEIFEEKEGNIEDEDMKSVKELARRFRLFFGLNAEKSDEIIMIHLGGIKFIATAGKNSTGIPTKVLYFDVLAEFSSKLLTKDKEKILEFLDRKLPTDSSSGGDEWGPLMRYQKSLGLVEENKTQDAEKRRSTRRSGNQPIVPEEAEREWSDAGSDHDSRSDQSNQKRKESRGNEMKKRTLKKTPLATTKKRKTPKASTPGADTSLSASFHTIPQRVQTELDAMDITDVSREKASTSQQSGRESHMEVDSE